MAPGEEQTLGNDGASLTVALAGDDDVNEYVLAITCDDGACAGDDATIRVAYTAAPTPAPSTAPTPAPSTAAPSPGPSTAPTPAPSAAPSPAPTPRPSAAPSAAPSASPTPAPSSAPSLSPTAAPTEFKDLWDPPKGRNPEVQPFDCENHPAPLQVLMPRDGAGNYLDHFELRELDLATGAYDTIFKLDYLDDSLYKDYGFGTNLCGNQPVSWEVGAKLQNSLARSNRSRFG